MKNIYRQLLAMSGTVFLIGGAYADGEWPPVGCKTAQEIRDFRVAHPGNEMDMGVYSGDDTATNNGNIFWLGFDHGNNVLPPNTPTKVPSTPQGTGYLLRWALNDTVIISGNRANQQVSSHYKWDYDQTRDGDYAVDAIAINKCKLVGEDFVCEQPLFGKDAWINDFKGGNFELCPPVILPEEPGSIYVYDMNDNNVVEQYEYSLALILTAGGNKSGLRVIIDPKITNGGN